jgi:hypothetical protein
MKKLTGPALIFVAVLAIGAATATSALAEPHKWLVNGADIVGEVKVTYELTKPLFVEDSNAFGLDV